MWKVKYFETFEAQQKWIDANEHQYQITVIYVNNGYAVEYKKVRVI